MLVRLKKIKIQDTYEKPNVFKMMEREAYFIMHRKLAVPIVINKDNVLVDGYTSYLIAKMYGKRIVKVQRV